ncbi:alkaline phosphatase family protein [Thermomonospora cellulosilytica]|uniref:Putative AlkP superfamily pyrophosphatase or phosphodiesterase n=1 Tax=Thermomonospora cellulosilytica TaxID=1411118 RepID=A0A7W3MWR8_9ACTN|nr:nucleotide pyrophosphatase/phosphodiesterase family protein [Thermomonospora cellulosilytica]MBA9003308.1 putative AlkP superfamily pyrophosphatase or phosphodiesterase [Thermomonospora cellulosilytica]
MRPLVVIDVAGLTPGLLAHMPGLGSAVKAQAMLRPVLPTVTCSVQASLLTGLPPSGHGIVGNGWYFRDLGEVLLWRQHHGLIEGPRVWDDARRVKPGLTVANVCWWYAMGAPVDWTVTPRPIYYADGRKSPDCYTDPPELRVELTRRFGRFPLFSYWGPKAGIESSQWIVAAASYLLESKRPDLTLVYIPHLDYDLQRYGPSGPQAVAAARNLDVALQPLLDQAESSDAAVVVLSEYGITDVRHPVDINRALRGAGLLRVYRQAGMEYLDPWTSRAFAVADHQLAHVYVRDPADLPGVRSVLSGVPGIEQVLEGPGLAAHGLDHPRSGELVAVAEPHAWFTYYYWLDDDRAPDFARTVDIHRKPGYDPAELFMDPADPWVKARAAFALARKRLGFRSAFSVVPLDPRVVRGSHGRLPDSPADAPVLLCSEDLDQDVYAATEVKPLLLRLLGVTP